MKHREEGVGLYCLRGLSVGKLFQRKDAPIHAASTPSAQLLSAQSNCYAALVSAQTNAFVNLVRLRAPAFRRCPYSLEAPIHVDP